MKKTIYGVVALMIVLFASCNPTEKQTYWTLNLTEDTSVEYDDNGLWTETYTDLYYDVLCFTFQHYGEDGDWGKWYTGIIPCKDDGTEKTQAQSVASHGGMQGEGKPYMLCYWGDYADYTSGELVRSSDIYFSQGMADIYAPQYLYVNNINAVTDVLKNGGSLGARAFKEGDYFLLTIKALNSQKEVVEGAEVQVYLADYRDGKTDIIESWTKVDLTQLGNCFGLTFTMETTDNNDYGALTPTYFAFDGLTVTPSFAE